MSNWDQFIWGQGTWDEDLQAGGSGNFRVPLYREEGVGYRQNPSLIYRGVKQYLAGGSVELGQPHRRAVTLRIYNRNDILVRMLSSNAQVFPVSGLDWEVLDTGCGQFTLTATQDLGLEHDYRVDIHLWNNPEPVYAGFVQRRPLPGTTERRWEYAGYGGFALLDRVYFTRSYGVQPVRSIVIDVAKTIEQRQRVVYDDQEIALTNYSTVGELKFLRASAKEVVQQLADLAGGYEWGVDARRRFFFRPQATEADMHLWYGKHLETYIPQEDSSRIVNRLYVQAGKVRSDLDPGDLFYKTNWIPEGELNDPDSQAKYGVREGTFAAPSMLSLIDAMRAGDVELKRVRNPRQYARVSGLEYAGQTIAVDGLARIVGRGGREMILPKKRISYSLVKGRVKVECDLGDVDVTPATWVAQLAAASARESLIRQVSQNQL